MLDTNELPNMSQTTLNPISIPKVASRTLIDTQETLIEKKEKCVALKRKRHTRLPRLPVWVHLNQPNCATHNFGVRQKDPAIRKALMYGCNAFWLTPNGTTKKGTSTYMVEGGETKDSFYVTQMNKYKPSATLLLLTQRNGVNVVLLKPKETVFEGWTTKQLESVWPRKADEGKLKAEDKKLSSPEMRLIADRLFRSNGGAGVPLLRALKLTTFQTIVADLRKKKPLVGVVGATKVSLAKIQTLVANYEAAFGFWNPQLGSNSHMYKAQRDAVVTELAEYLRSSDFARFADGHALLTSEAAQIKVDASNMASAKGALPTSISTTTNNSQALYELKVDKLIGMVNAVAAPLECLDVSTPLKTLCQSMVKNSAYMAWVSAENVPSWEDLFHACRSDTGLANDNTYKILRNKSQETWYGMLCCLVLCYQSGIDCSEVAGEGNAIKDGNKISAYDRGQHLGKVKTHTQSPPKVKVKRSIQISFKGVCRQGKRPDIVKAWERIFKELQAFADKDFWTAGNITDTFGRLQIKIEVDQSLKTEKKKWLSRDGRKSTLVHLKWVFILYMESLQTGTVPTLQGFLTTMVTPLGSCFCSAYIAWVGTAVYNLRMRIKENPANTPSWIGKFKKKGFVTPTIENTIHGEPATLLFRALETMINIEWPKRKRILKSVQDNAVSLPESHGNTLLARAAAARMYWFIGAIRLNVRFAPRDAIVDRIRTMSQTFWNTIQPGDNHQKEFRIGLSLITEPFGSIKVVVAQSKVTGSDVDANTAKFDSKKHEVELYTPGAGFHPDYSSLASTTHRFLDAAQIISGSAANRRYTINVKDKDGMWQVMQATHVPSPANLHNSFNFAEIPQEKGVPYEELFSKFQADYLALRNKDLPPGKKRKKFVSNEKSVAHFKAIHALNVRMCYMPPRPTDADHTTSTGYALKTPERMRKFFRAVAIDMNRKRPIAIGNPPKKSIKEGKWNLQSILSPTDGFVTGSVTINSEYTFKPSNTLSNLVNHGFSADEIASLREICRAIEVEELIVHPKWYGRQTQLAMKLGLLFCARRIPGWIIGDASTDDILTAAANAQAQVEGHEGKGKVEEKGSIPMTNYVKSFALALANPAKYFEHFDRRVRAHPTPAVFSLDGIESFPSLIVPCIEHNASESALERALKDVRLLTTQEQMGNLNTLAVYRDLLQFIIDKQHDLPPHQHCVLRWFNARATYDADNLEQEIRQSPRKKQRK